MLRDGERERGETVGLNVEIDRHVRMIFRMLLLELRYEY